MFIHLSLVVGQFAQHYKVGTAYCEQLRKLCLSETCETYSSIYYDLR